MTKLEKMLKYVSEHNEFYKNRIKEYGITNPLDITQWPILTRKELQENRYNMFSDGYKTKYYNQQLRRQSSSGSSGVPVNVYWDYKDWYASNMSLWRKRLQWYGIHPSDKYVMFTLNAFNIENDGKTVYYIKEPANILSVNVSLIQNENGYEKLVDLINEFEPKWIYVQPFVLDKLIQAYICTGKLPPKTLKYIESVGEILSPDLKKRTIDFFEISLGNMYGSEEMNGIAYECPDHHMHVLDDNVFVEVMNKNEIVSSGDGDVIITNLSNKAMPLIRYYQGDMIDINNCPSKCHYGSNFSEIKLVKGRTLESIQLDGNTELNSFILLEILSEVNNEFNGAIVTYRYVFDTHSKCLYCYISLDDSKMHWFHSVQLRFVSVLKKRKLYDKISGFVLTLEGKNESTVQKRKIIDFI